MQFPGHCLWRVQPKNHAKFYVGERVREAHGRAKGPANDQVEWKIRVPFLAPILQTLYLAVSVN